MALNDSVLVNMTPSKWNATLAPKVLGVQALSDGLRTTAIDHQLDFFVTTSSVSHG